MFIIFGWGKQTMKGEGPVFRNTCQHCKNNDIWELYTRRTWFTLFFIPLIPYSTEHLLICPVCNYGYRVEKTKYAELREIARCNVELMDEKITEEEHVERMKQIAYAQETGNSSDISLSGKTETQKNFLRQMQEIEHEKELEREKAGR